MRRPCTDSHPTADALFERVLCILLTFLVLHWIGAHYVSLVPYDRWWQAVAGATLNDLLGWERIHYDRIVHFAYGASDLPAAVDLYRRYAVVRGAWRWFLPVFFVMSHSSYTNWSSGSRAHRGPELGEAYLSARRETAGTHRKTWRLRRANRFSL